MINAITHPAPRLPSHGWIACRKCFSGDAHVLDLGPWRVVNDPGAWGSSTPEIVVLGFSKGFTQANEAARGRFDDVPFKDMRPRLSQVLQTLGLLRQGEMVDGKMKAGETRFAFGSLVRCSLSRFDEAEGKHICTGKVMPSAFREGIKVQVARCAETFLGDLPSSVRLIVMLGNEDRYIKGCRETIRALRPADFAVVNEVAYRLGRVTFTHAGHPSGLNGHLGKWLRGPSSTTSGRKRDAALAAIRSCFA